jgi:TonB-linked SusC/RagA family outer membrane protein
MRKKISFIKGDTLRKIIFFLCVCGCSLSLFAQGGNVKGTVTDTGGEPVVGAAVAVKGSSAGVLTGADGTFSITVGTDAVLVISCLGYVSQEIAIGSQTEITVTLADDMMTLDDVVVVGYGTQKKASLTGALTSLKAAEIDKIPTGNLTTALAGRLAGVTVSQSSGGRPGNSSDIVIRARGTWNSAAPLYVIDGVVRDSRAFDALDSNEIDDLSVLKDAAAASVYGSRAANGVILVTTKRGKTGKPIISYSGSISMANFTVTPKRETALQHIAFTNDYEREFNVSQGPTSAAPLDPNYGFNYYPTTYKDDGTPVNGSVFTDDEIAWYKTHDYDLLDEAWQTPVTTNHSVNVSGGSDKVRYFAGLTYYNETGAFKVLNYTKYSVRGNLEADITKNLKATLMFNTDNSNDTRGHGEDTKVSSLYTDFIKASRLFPGKVDGKYIGLGSNGNGANPVAKADGAAGKIDDKYTNVEYTAALQWELPWIKGLNAKILYNSYNRFRYYKDYGKPYLVYALTKEGTNSHIVSNEFSGGVTTVGGQPSLYERHDNNSNYQLNGILNYNNTFGKHDIAAMFAYEQAEGGTEWFGAQKTNYELNDLPYFNFGPTDKSYYNVEGQGSEDARLSYIGRLNYGYDNRYLAEFSFRSDASVKFDPAHRWGFFPTGSLAWRISEESFLKNVNAISNLKLRGSVGLTGNDAVGSYQWLDRASTGTGAYYGGSTAFPGTSIGTVANPLITWEKSLSYNAGLDAGFLGNMFTFGVDYFFRHTYDILGSQTNEVPDTFGASLADSNYGIVDSYGVEIELGFNKQINDNLSVWARGNFGYSDNKLVEWAETGVPAHLSKIGKNWDRLAGYLSDGIIKTMKDNGDGTWLINGQYVVPATGYLENRGSNYDITSTNKYAMRHGSVFYKDIGSPNGEDEEGNRLYSSEPDGKITGDDADKTWIVDHHNPPYNFGLLLGGNWKGLSLEVFFQGLAGHQALIATTNAAQYAWDAANWSYWSEDHFSYVNNPTGSMPAPTNGGGHNMGGGGLENGSGNPDFWVRNMSFIRLKNVTLSYDLNKTILSKAGISLARIYVTGNNVALLYNPLKYFDPEASSTTNNPNPGSGHPYSGITTYPLMRTFTVGVNFSF